MTRWPRVLVSCAVVAVVMSCEYEPPMGPEAIIESLVLEELPYVADGSSTRSLTARLGEGYRPSTVTMSASAPLLEPGGVSSTVVPVDATGSANVLLRAPQAPMTVVLTAASGTSSHSMPISYQRACASSIIVEPSSFAIKQSPTETITINAHARRSIGTVSVGTTVRFRAMVERVDGSIGDDVGQFGAPTLTNESGLATVRYTLGDSQHEGRIAVTASTCGEASDSVVGVTRVFVATEGAQ